MSNTLQDLNPLVLRAFLRWLGGDKSVEMRTMSPELYAPERGEHVVIVVDHAVDRYGGFRRISNAYARVHAIMVANTMGLGPAELAIVYNGIADYFATKAAKLEATLTPALKQALVEIDCEAAADDELAAVFGQMAEVSRPPDSADPLGMVSKAAEQNDD